MNQRQEVDRRVFVAHDEPPELLEPRMGPFDQPTPLVSSELAAVLVRGDRVIAARRDDRLDALRHQGGADGVAVIAPICDQAIRALPRSARATRSLHRDRIKRLLEERDLRGGSRRHGNSERSTLAIGQYHELRSLTALGGADGSPPFFATTKVPSMKHSSQRTCWRSLSWAKNARQRFNNVSSAAHWASRRWTVLFEPYRAGSSLHGAPVQSTQRMPSKQRRSSTRGRPPFGLRFAGSNCSRILSHCASLSWRHAMRQTPFSGTTHGAMIPLHEGFWDEF